MVEHLMRLHYLATFQYLKQNTCIVKIYFGARERERGVIEFMSQLLIYNTVFA